MRLKKITQRIAIIFGLITAPGLLTVESVAESVQVRFGTFDLAPYGFYDGQNASRGLLRDINGAIAERAGLTYSDNVKPLKRVTKDLQKGIVMCSTFIPAPWSKKELSRSPKFWQI